MDKSLNQIHIGSGAGFAGDRFDAAIPVVDTLAEHRGPKYLIYEVMGERTLAIAQRIKRDSPSLGYSPWLDTYLPAVLVKCVTEKIRIVANFGNANPLAAAKRTMEIGHELGLTGLRVGIVEGDDLTAVMSKDELLALPTIEGTDIAGREIQGANAYLGARPVAEALALSVDVVLVGRTTDAALVLGPLLHEFKWSPDDYDRLAAGTIAGHLLECGGQVSGGYFADPGFKDVSDLDQLGFPIAEIYPNGEFIITKAKNTGGMVNRATVIEQLLYEVHNPAAYLTPDVSVDFTGVNLTELESNRIRVTGARGHPPPATLKATLSVDGGYLGEAEISYAGPNALARARLAADIVRKRLNVIGVKEPCRVEILGTGSVHQSDDNRQVNSQPLDQNGEFRVRAAIRCGTRRTANSVVNEVLALYCCGPAGGGGVRQSVTPQVSTASVLVDRFKVEANTRVYEYGHK